ncbi:MAG: cell division protein FtsQ/DivIB [Candidatus Accumulibacter sp.]|jgi:cell division protein FtsQ|nr:cell division protein FtsQ/DivIB [Accumulibacter sp.]
MWNRPQFLNALADLLFAAGAAALLVAAAIGLARLPFFPVSEVAVMQPLREVRRAEIERAILGALRGNFFSVGLEALRESVEKLPWVRRAELRRRWPARLELGIEEHAPAAAWGSLPGQWVNSHGEVFAAAMRSPPAVPLPRLSGPAGYAPEMLATLRLAASLFKPIGRRPAALEVSPRLALRMTLDDGMIVELGRQRAEAPVRERLERFVEFYPAILTAAGRRPEVVDMRYPRGFALRAAAAPESEGGERP